MRSHASERVRILDSTLSVAVANQTSIPRRLGYYDGTHQRSSPCSPGAATASPGQRFTGSWPRRPGQPDRARTPLSIAGRGRAGHGRELLLSADPHVSDQVAVLASHPRAASLISKASWWACPRWQRRRGDDPVRRAPNSADRHPTSALTRWALARRQGRRCAQDRSRPPRRAAFADHATRGWASRCGRCRDRASRICSARACSLTRLPEEEPQGRGPKRGPGHRQNTMFLINLIRGGDPALKTHRAGAAGHPAESVKAMRCA